MPGFDGKGPIGRGPVTGGARGRCNPAGLAGYGNAAGESSGRGRRRSSGRGQRGCNGSGRGSRGCAGSAGNRGRGVGDFISPGDSQMPEDELNALKLQSDSLKNTLDAMKSRIDALEKTE